MLGPTPLCAARLVRAAADFSLLGGDALPAGAIGFVFAATLPASAPADLTLRLLVDTSAGRHDHAVRLRPPEPKPASPPPIRAVIETARIDERGLLRVGGWATGLSAIEQLHVFIGTRLLGDAQRGLRRDDVAAMHPHYPNALHAGFLLQQEASDADLGQHEIRVVIGMAGGIVRAFTAPLVRPAQLRRRAPETVARLNCDEVTLTDHGHFAIKGWAVCSSGVAGVDIELDGEPIGVALAAEDRPDIGNLYPCVVGAPRAGFRLERALGGRFTGDHVVRLMLRGVDGEETTIFQPVAARAAAAAVLPARRPEDGAIRHFLDAPKVQDGVAIETVRGFLSLNGWAFGRDRIDRIEVFVDGQFQGMAHHGIRRDDLQAAFPGEEALLCGFAMVIPPQVMKPGMHKVRLVIRDVAGRSRETAFSVRADKAAAGPGPWWLRTKLPQAEIDLQHAILAARDRAPSWAIVVAAGTADAAALSATIESLRWQAYERWRLVILAAEADIAPLAEAFGDVTGMPVGFRAARPERCLADSAGAAEFLAVLAPGDRLGEDALLELSVESALDPAAEFLYSDERRIDPADGEEKAFFKPDFSPDLLLSTNYIGRLWTATPALLRRAGLTEGDLAARGEYDAVLRLTEQAGPIRHVAKVLCATAPTPQSARGGRRGLERQALLAAMRRRGIAGALLAGPIRGSYRIRRATRGGGKISIVIPTNAARGLIRTAIASIRAHTTWPDYEIVVLDNIPPDGTPEQRDCKAWIATNADQVIEIRGRFNWSRFNNRAARQARGDYLLFLNDDIEVPAPDLRHASDWLHGLVEHAQRPEIGVVGPQLLYPDGRVQHAGMFLARAAARHAFRFYPRDEAGPFGLALTQRDVISVTGACMMMRRAVFDALGGFDERHAVINNDLDFNLRARAKGLGIVFTPAVSLTHHEMASRAGLPDTHDSPAFERDWGALFRTGDPFFSRHFSPDCDDYAPESEPVRVFAAGHPLIARDKIRKILVLKLDHIGDFITAFPAFRRLRQHFPHAELTVLAASASLALTGLEPAIDRAIGFDFFHARSGKGRLSLKSADIDALRARLAPERFDLAIDLRRQPETRSLLQATGTRWTAGFETAHQHPWLDIALPFEGDLALHRKRAHVADALVALIDAISTQCETDRAVITPAPDRAAARRDLAALLDPPPGPAQPLVCVHTGAGARNKQWPAASFARLIDHLAGTANAAILLIGGPDETEFSQHVIRLARHRHAITTQVGRIPLRNLPAVLRGADLYVGNDSGPKHIAAALAIPTIGIHSGTVAPTEWGAMGPHALTLGREMTCSPCYLAHARDCHRAMACLDGLRVGDVFAACLRLLGLRRRGDLAGAEPGP